MRRQAILYIDPSAILNVLTTFKLSRTFCVKKGLPRDTKLRGASFDCSRNLFALVLESPKFSPVPFGKPLPRLTDPIFEEVERNAAPR